MQSDEEDEDELMPTMELMREDQMARYNTYDLSSGSSSSKWYNKSKNVRWLIFGVIITLAVVCTFLAGYYTGLRVNRQSRKRIGNESEEVTFKDLPPVEWDDVCPKIESQCSERYSGIPPLLLVSLDGFRADYLERGFTPTLKKLSLCGTHAKYMYPVYPSKTFPNHYSQVTGLYPASHGIIDNNMYDPIRNKVFKLGTPETFQPYWWEKEPIWVTAAKQGKKTAFYFWPGSDVEINGILPTYYYNYSNAVPFEIRVDKILEWLDFPEATRPNFLTLYFDQPDVAGHAYGIDANETNESLVRVDRMVARLFSGLQQRKIIGCVNIMIMSDHGMSNIKCNRIVNLQNYINVSEVYASYGTFGRIRVKNDNSSEATDNMISKLQCQNEHLRVYKKEELPVRMHYADNLRIEPIILNTDAGWTIQSQIIEKYCNGGSHGYDNLFHDMRALFTAYGPSFKPNATVDPFINTELYELMTELINITGNPNNGTKGSLHHLLNAPNLLPQPTEPASPATSTIPTDEEEYKFRVYAAKCTCKQTEKQKDVEDTKKQNLIHLPFGIPYSTEDNNTLQLLYNEDYVVAYDPKFRLPMWVSYTLQKPKYVTDLKEICWKGDARVGSKDTPECENYSESIVLNNNILQQPLFPSYFSDPTYQEQATYVTNSVPKSLNHTLLIQEKFYHILDKWAADDQLNVLMGPAFNFLATGIRPDIGTIMRSHEKFGPLVVPTHYFAVITWCSYKSENLSICNPANLETVAFLLPNSPFPRNCESDIDIISKNSARVVDVEKLTGLSFFTNLPIYEAIRLRIQMPQRIDFI